VSTTTKRAAIVVLDGVGAGEAPDAARYGDTGSNTLGNLARAVDGMRLPNLQRAGLGNILPLQGVPFADSPTAGWGLLVPRSAGKDSTTGHWEIAGVELSRPFPTYPRGFPLDLVERFAHQTGRGVIGNVAGSGTDIISRFGTEHQRTGSWILYTSADSVFQIAAHEEVIPLEELYRGCQTARDMLVAPHDVSRVIARPFVGAPGSYTRTKNRRDFSISPPRETLLDTLAEAGIARTGVGKVDDLFAGRSIQSTHTASNSEGIDAIGDWLGTSQSGLLLANLVDFDQQFGHRNDVLGFYQALREFDAAIPALLSALREDDLLFITADHGNDPTTASTDHARECVPVLVLGPRIVPRSIGRRDTFADLGATVAQWLGIGGAYRGTGSSFLSTLVPA
jgi:phosphopentomutase